MLLKANSWCFQFEIQDVSVWTRPECLVLFAHCSRCEYSRWAPMKMLLADDVIGDQPMRVVLAMLTTWFTIASKRKHSFMVSSEWYCQCRVHCQCQVAFLPICSVHVTHVTHFSLWINPPYNPKWISESMSFVHNNWESVNSKSQWHQVYIFKMGQDKSSISGQNVYTLNCQNCLQI